MPYNNWNNVQSSNQCNIEACKQCRNQFSCPKYQQHVASLDNTFASMPSTLSGISQLTEQNLSVSSAENMQARAIDFTPIIQSNQGLKDSIVDVILDRFAVLENNYNKLKDINEGLVDKIVELVENFSKFDTLSNIIETYSIKNDTDIDFNSKIPDNELSLYTGITDEDPEKVLVEKKGFLGLGRSKWVEENKNNK